jgi:pimeloyl-ACP methyl ester carboxylesterase
MAMDEVRTPRGTFRCRAAGARGEPVVLFLHGFPESSACWDAQAPVVGAAGYEAVAIDQRGYSPGARPDEIAAYRMDELVGDVLAVLDGLGASRADLVGHDFGGSVAWTVTGRHPERVRSLAVASTPHPAAFAEAYRAHSAGQGEDQHQRSGYMRSFREARRGELEEVFLAEDAKVLRGVFDGLPESAVEAHLSVLREPGAMVAAVDWYRAMSGAVSSATPPSAVPTLYVWSDEDPALGPAAAYATASHVTGPYRFVVLEGVGHWIPELAAERFTELLLEHLGTPPGPAHR